MPFRGLQNGELVVPAMVSDDGSVSCLECGRSMHVRDGTERARHFSHPNTGTGNACSGPDTGESATHARCVALAVAALQEAFSTQAARCAPEVELDVSMSGSGKCTRRADALLEFESENPYFGTGLVVEVQHKNHEKDIDVATHDYLTAGYSVVWLSSDDFDDDQLDYSEIDDAFASEDGSGYSIREESPNRFLQCQAYYYSGEHNWKTVPSYVLTCEEEYEICVSPDCTLRRQYDEQRSEYTYDAESITTPDLPIRVLDQTLVRQHVVKEFEEWLTQRYFNATLEKALADRSEIGQCSGPKGFHEWYSPKQVEKSPNGVVKFELRACKHCSVHLLTDFRGRREERTDLFFSDAPDPEWNLLSLKADPRACEHKNRQSDTWYEFCADCGVSIL